ncbi:hypothetical protein MMC07_005113 [Pseudocyphellaria aurata]|nr:hypothetical protein [Pseudocyphellaria aurata]
MAEAVFRSLTTSHPCVARIDSAGTGAYHAGDSPDPRTMSTLEDHGIADYRHGARIVQLSDFSDFDYIFAMDRDNLRDLQRSRDRWAAKNGGGNAATRQLMLFGDFGGRKGEEVVDPYYGRQDGFEVAYEQMVRFSKGFISQVLGEEEEISS